MKDQRISEQETEQPRITPKHCQTRDFMCRYWVQHGYWPTIREIADGLGLNFVTVLNRLNVMEARGAAEQVAFGRARCWTIPVRAWPPNKPNRIPVMGRIKAENMR